MTLKFQFQFLLSIILAILSLRNPRLRALPRISYTYAQPVVETETPATNGESSTQLSQNCDATNGESSTQLSQNSELEWRQKEELEWRQKEEEEEEKEFTEEQKNEKEKLRKELFKKINQLKEFESQSFANFQNYIQQVHLKRGDLDNDKSKKIDLNNNKMLEKANEEECDNFTRAIICHCIYSNERGMVLLDSGNFGKFVGKLLRLKQLHSDLTKPLQYIDTWNNNGLELKAKDYYIKKKLINFEDLINTGHRLFLNKQKNTPPAKCPKFKANPGYSKPRIFPLPKCNASYKKVTVKKVGKGKNDRISVTTMPIPGYTSHFKIEEVPKEEQKSKKRGRGSR
jgi:hypothetical protein